MNYAEEVLALASRIENGAGVSAVPHELSSAFEEGYKALEPDSPCRQCLGWEAALYAYVLPVHGETGREAEEFVPFIQSGESRYPPLVRDFPDEATDYFRKRLASSGVPTARARLADFLWLRTREVAFADRAITEYAKAALAVSSSAVGAMMATEYLVRASAFAQRLRRDRPDLRAAIRDVSERVLKERSGHVFDLVRRTAKEIARDSGLVDFFSSKLLDLADTAAGRGGQERLTERFALEALLELTRAIGNTQEGATLRRRTAFSLEHEADERANEAPLIQAALLQDAVRSYAALGMVDELARAKEKLHIATQGAAANMKALSVEVSIPTGELREAMMTLLAQGRQHAPWFHLQLLALGCLWRPWADVVARTAEPERRAPLSSLVNLVMLGPDDRPFPRPTDSAVAREFNEIRRYVEDVQFGLGIAEAQISMLRELEGWSVDLILDALRSGVAFGEETIDAIAPGVRDYDEEKHWEAVHVLVPQIERVIRGVAQKLGVDTYRYMSSTGAIHWATLDQLLEQEPVSKLLAQLRPDLPRELACLLTDGRGLNLRHDVAHGILRPSSTVRSYPLLCIMILLTLSVFSASEERGESGVPNSQQQ